MDIRMGMLAVAGVFLLVLLIGFIKKKGEILLDFATRTVVCLIAAYFLNSFFSNRGIDIMIGFNIISVLTFGSLGFCGMLALYGILFLQLL
ncbi:MAG: pro-sigmaK processing inhibitor BofA family protein [Lachnospiraceae bacterium]|nr:pro-sigmaK processing inhibitor BofA family protein [Lachnospiraceae bacterium]